MRTGTALATRFLIHSAAATNPGATSDTGTVAEFTLTVATLTVGLYVAISVQNLRLFLRLRCRRLEQRLEHAMRHDKAFASDAHDPVAFDNRHVAARGRASEIHRPESPSAVRVRLRRVELDRLDERNACLCLIGRHHILRPRPRCLRRSAIFLMFSANTARLRVFGFRECSALRIFFSVRWPPIWRVNAPTVPLRSIRSRASWRNFRVLFLRAITFSFPTSRAACRVCAG